MSAPFTLRSCPSGLQGQLNAKLVALAALLACAACSAPAHHARVESEAATAPPLTVTAEEPPEGTLEETPEGTSEEGTPAPPPTDPEPRAPAHAAESEDEEALKQANNPLADMKAFSVHDYYVPNVTGTEETANQFWFRYAQPIHTGVGDWLMRASLPLITAPTGGFDSESGTGDANVLASYLFNTGNPDVSVGVGPLLGLPTATDPATGTGQWSLGAAAVYFDATSPHYQYGGLVTYQHKIAGSSSDPDVNYLAIQPFGLGLGKVVKVDKTVFNFFIEPQMAVLSDGPGQPAFQIFFGLNTQFLG